MSSKSYLRQQIFFFLTSAGWDSRKLIIYVTQTRVKSSTVKRMPGNRGLNLPNANPETNPKTNPKKVSDSTASAKTALLPVMMIMHVLVQISHALSNRSLFPVDLIAQLVKPRCGNLKMGVQLSQVKNFVVFFTGLCYIVMFV